MRRDRECDNPSSLEPFYVASIRADAPKMPQKRPKRDPQKTQKCSGRLVPASDRSKFVPVTTMLKVLLPPKPAQRAHPQRVHIHRFCEVPPPQCCIYHLKRDEERKQKYIFVLSKFAANCSLFCSLVGRAPALRSGGAGFDSGRTHRFFFFIPPPPLRFYPHL